MFRLSSGCNIFFMIFALRSSSDHLLRETPMVVRKTAAKCTFCAGSAGCRPAGTACRKKWRPWQHAGGEEPAATTTASAA